MAIPKEPRALMINLMYLVLTAMLALNVSAEIFNAFKVVDKGLQKSNAILDAANSKIPAQVKKFAKKKSELGKYGDRASEVTALSKEFSEYIDGIWEQMAVYYPEDDPKYPGELKNKKDKDTPTRILVGEEGKSAEGAVIKSKILEYRKKFLELVDEKDREAMAKKITLEIDDKTWQDKGKASWSYYMFGHMPVAAVKPMFTKFKNDAKSTESAVLNYLLEKVGTDDNIVLDKFQVVSSPEKSYIIKGETFKTDIFLSASASQSSNTGVSIKVNGSNVKTKDGVASFSQTASQTGVKKYNAAISVKNPVTGEVKTYKKEFEYEVGERSVNVSADKMNVFYIGVDNPVSVAAAGVSSNALKVNGSGVTMTKAGKGKYTVKATKPGKASITVSGGGLEPTKFDFRVKRIPDPVARLSKSSGGTMGSGEFKAQGGVMAALDNFDFEARCKIQGFQITKVSPRKDPIEAMNSGGKYATKASNMVRSAKPGDTFFFDNVKARCPGDKAGRKINSMVFKIK